MSGGPENLLLDRRNMLAASCGTLTFLSGCTSSLTSLNDGGSNLTTLEKVVVRNRTTTTIQFEPTVIVEAERTYQGMQSVPPNNKWVISREWPREEGIFTIIGNSLSDCQDAVLSIDTSKPDLEAAVGEPYIAYFSIDPDKGLVAWWDRIQD